MAELKLFEELKGEFNAEKEHPEKFIQTLAFANEGNKKLLDEKNIKLKPSDWIVLSIDKEVLEKTIVRAEEFGFLDAYVQNPAFLKQDVDAVIKRMGELEHLGIPYKNEKCKYQSFLFSQRGFNYVVEKATGKKDEVVASTDTEINDIELKEAADRIMETFALTSEREAVYKRILEVEKEGLSVKEALMEVFKTYSDNLDYLSTNIDEILEANEELAKGRVA